MIDIKRALKSDRIMKALTGLSRKEFLKLVPIFGKHLGPVFLEKRNVQSNLGRKFVLKTYEQKLFYILLYVKCYPTFDLAAFMFNVDRSSCCRWTHWFIAVLERTLGKELVLPKRKVSSIEEFVELFPTLKKIYIDGTERPIRRPKDSKKQRENYSGKKKRHTKKNLIVSDKEKKIVILSNTREGKVHDLRNLRDEEIASIIPEKVTAAMDGGFLGIQKDYPKLKVIMPKRKPKGRELTEKEKEQNRMISSERVINENAIGGVKRLRIVSDVYRNIKENFEDKVMLIACGLWNLHLEMV